MPAVVTVASGYDHRNQRSRCRNPSGHVHRNVGHDPGITGHVGSEYSIGSDHHLQDVSGALRPDEWLGADVVVRDVFINGRDQIVNAGEHATAQAALKASVSWANFRIELVGRTAKLRTWLKRVISVSARPIPK